MPYQLLADGVVVVHVAFVIFVVAGGLLALRWPRVAWAHLPAAAWGAWIELSGGTCPLTPVEQWLRYQASDESYAGGFIEHYLLPILYPGALTREVQLVLAGLVVAVNLIVYRWVFRRGRQRSWREA